MKTFKYYVALLVSIVMIEHTYGQDPNFSQFFSSPLNINPALTANIRGQWRVISNYRNQWIGPSTPYTTGTISFDTKILQNTADNYIDEGTRIGMGGMFMYDQAMEGVLKSSYASFNVSGNIRIAQGGGIETSGARMRHSSKIKMDEGTGNSRLGVGLGAIYGNKRIDFNKLTFGEQFTGLGFDSNLPSGETALSNMKPYFSTSAGILFSTNNENSNFDLGVAAFHFNKPRQTVLDDDHQFLATRYVVHGNFETFLSDNAILNTNAIYQNQSGASYFSIGGALGYFLPNNEDDVILNAGLWYWSKNALVPYVGFNYRNFQLGVTYDITVSLLKEAPKKFRTFELCIIFRGGGEKSSSGVIPSPWK